MNEIVVLVYPLLHLLLQNCFCLCWLLGMSSRGETSSMGKMFCLPLRVWVWFPNSVTWTCSKNIIFERVSVTVYDKVYYYTNFSFQTTTNIANVYKKTFFPTYRNLHYLQSLLTYKARSCQVSSSCLQYTSSIAIKFDAELAVNLDSICTPLSI